MENWKEVLEQVQGMIDRVYMFKEHKMYSDLDTMIKITREFTNMKLDPDTSEGNNRKYMDKINELVLKLKSSFARTEINDILYP